MATTQDFNSPFTLYYAATSICATVVRLTFAFRGSPRSDRPDMTMHMHLIDIGPEKAEQLTEFYLTKVNPKGLVPVLVNDKLLEKPMPESADISWYFCEWYPDLLPKEHEHEIRYLMDELHKVNYGVLTYGTGSKHFGNMLATVTALLERPDLSAEHRTALERKAYGYKMAPTALTEALLADHEDRAKAVLQKITVVVGDRKLVDEGDQSVSYMYGPKPTVLDAHLLVFLCRVLDMDRSYLVPEKLLEWAKVFRQSDTWKEIMPSVSTKPPYWS